MIKLLHFLKNTITKGKANPDEYPDILKTKVWSWLGGAAFSFLVCFSLLFFSQGWIIKYGLMLSFIFLCRGLQYYYFLYYGKWVRLSGTVTSNTSTIFKGLNKRRIIEFSDEESCELYNFTTSKRNLYREGDTITLYISSAPLYEVNGVKQLSVILDTRKECVIGKKEKAASM